jgi:hypothetical protein
MRALVVNQVLILYFYHCSCRVYRALINRSGCRAWFIRMHILPKRLYPVRADYHTRLIQRELGAAGHHL